MSKFIVLDIIFYANSLNYDQGYGNVQELKKITKWDGKQYTFVSRYALRYSILHHAHSLFEDDWSLAKEAKDDEQNGLSMEQTVVQAKGKPRELVEKFPEFDLFGYMMTSADKKKGKKTATGSDDGKAEINEPATTRTAVTALSHAVSLTPFNYDSHFNANLDVTKRAGGVGSNPFTVEEHYSYYVYSIVINCDRVGVLDESKEPILDIEQKIKRINQLVEAILTLKRQIKGRQEDLSPKILVMGLYNNKPYESFKDRLVLADDYEEEITQTEEKIENGTKIVRRIIKTNKPRFVISGLDAINRVNTTEIKNKIKEFMKQDRESSEKFIYSVPELTVDINTNSSNDT